MGWRRAILLTALVAWPAAAAEEVGSPEDIIRALKAHQKSLGIPETRNFQLRSGAREAFFRCYYTGKLELPDSYDELEFAEGTAAGCSIDPDRYDVFFYPAEAVADGNAPVTAALASAPPERQAVVVAHEDLHQALERLPVHLAEAAATLAGFLTAADFARRQGGESSALYEALSGEAELFLAKASVVNSFHHRLRELYREVRRGELGTAEALALKEKIFGELERACRAIEPEPKTFNRCPAALNNAGLAFDYTYTKRYGPFWELYEALGRDLGRFIETVLALARRPGNEREVLEALQRAIGEAAAQLN